MYVDHFHQGFTKSTKKVAFQLKATQAVEKISTALFFPLKFPSPHFIIEKSLLKEGVFSHVPH